MQRLQELPTSSSATEHPRPWQRAFSVATGAWLLWSPQMTSMSMGCSAGCSNGSDSFQDWQHKARGALSSVNILQIYEPNRLFTDSHTHVLTHK